ncbi:MAG: hypothetical protein ACRCZB_05985 [Bacteroidales bacterium]
MKKELFVKSVNALQNQIEHDIEFSEILAKAFPECHSPNLLPKNHFLSNAMLEVLQATMKDDHGHSWIEYYCYELEFGKNSEKLVATDEQGHKIPLSNAEELWQHLEKQKKNHEPPKGTKTI